MNTGFVLLLWVGVLACAAVICAAGIWAWVRNRQSARKAMLIAARRRAQGRESDVTSLRATKGPLILASGFVWSSSQVSSLLHLSSAEDRHMAGAR